MSHSPITKKIVPPIRDLRAARDELGYYRHIIEYDDGECHDELVRKAVAGIQKGVEILDMCLFLEEKLLNGNSEMKTLRKKNASLTKEKDDLMKGKADLEKKIEQQGAEIEKLTTEAKDKGAAENNNVTAKRHVDYFHDDRAWRL